MNEPAPRRPRLLEICALSEVKTALTSLRLRFVSVLIEFTISVLVSGFFGAEFFCGIE